MESCYGLAAKFHPFSLPSNYVVTPSLFSFHPLVNEKSHKWSKLKGAKRRSSISNLEWKKEEDEMMMDMEKELRMEKKGKCKEETGGIVELLECLEREAIMGEDQGKEPKDYNRRAEIFDKSSRIFQQLRETNMPSK